MTVAKKLALIAAGYALSIGGGLAAVAINELRIPDDVKETSGGMVAFGDMIMFVLGTGVVSLAPTWFLLELWVEKSRRTLLAAELAIAAMGPASWLAVRWMATGASPQGLPEAFSGVLGLVIAFAAIPRIVFGPVMLMIEGATILLVRERLPRALLATAMLLEVVPLGLFVLHMAAATYR